VNAKELQRWLKEQGCTFQTHPGGSGHITVYLNGRKSQLPMHGGSKELGPKLVHQIKKQLGLR
jgi:mRNA interferase HicA